ncbi:cobalt-zinc-cadmium resistance protein [Archangium sp. Cb G35]|uniref:TolC family protein n=1 Tax=Archangium sp. Cb G35 TaxID=1920190 RepID=UPI0009361226|nr:TolC family protein [Archangium sp. Cb G35]OJT24208.1 cobalt-zinc-cadmium resistance protein [Archangium sp. Cb G35]
MFHRLAVAAFGLVTVLLWPRPGAAQPSDLTLEEALSLARQRAPALLEASGRVAEAQGPVAGASPLLNNNPTLALEAGPRTLATGEQAPNVVVGLSQPVELGGKRGSRLDAARAGLAREMAGQRDTERRVLGEVAATFLRALHARERLRLARAAEEAAWDFARSTQRRFEAGDVPVVDVNVARVALARARADVASAEGAEAVQLGALREWLGLPADAQLSPRGDLSALAAGPVELPATMPERPDVTALVAELEEARAEQRLGEGSTWPDLNVGVRYENEGDERALVGTLGVTLPLFARGQSARVSGEARVRRLQVALEAARRAQAVQVQSALVQYRKEREAVELLEGEALPLLADNELLARKSYEAGEMGLAAFLLVRRDVLDARADYLARLLQAALSRVQLTVQTGVLR